MNNDLRPEYDFDYSDAKPNRFAAGGEPEQDVVSWANRDRELERKLKALFRDNLDSWIAMQSDRKFEQKWHVGREMLDWFYKQKLIEPDEYEALHVRHDMGKGGMPVELYRLIWRSSGRASDKVAAISLAPRMGPSKGHIRHADNAHVKSSFTNERLGRIPDTRALEHLKAEKELYYGEGGWIYVYGYEENLRYSERFAEAPLLKVGHTSGEYTARIRAQVRGTEIPDCPRVLRAYRVIDSASVESVVHGKLKREGFHHRRAGGSEWFKVDVIRLDEIVELVMRSQTSR